MSMKIIKTGKIDLKKYILVLFLAVVSTYGQVLQVSQEIQEQDQWCWAGVSSCILDYYGMPTTQCEIAEYAREVCDWHSFGTKNCCDYPNGECNYWNYSFGSNGSINDIISHFANVQSTGVYRAMEFDEVHAELESGRPFVVRWGWSGGGGHFVLGYGIEDSTIYYMNPWFGEGKKIADYDWLVQDEWGVHTWTHSLKIDTTPTDVKDNSYSGTEIKIFPNPANDVLQISGVYSGDTILLSDSYGNLLNISNSNTSSIDISGFSNGIYYLRINHLGKMSILSFVVVK